MFLRFLVLFFCFNWCFLSSQELDLKEEIKKCINQINQSTDRSDLQVDLAILYWKDQDQEQAFRTYLQAIEGIQVALPTNINKEDEQLYQKALTVYLDHSHGSPQEISAKLLKDYVSVFKERPNAHLLGFIVAAAYANQGDFEDFFKVFYNAYKYYPDHYLAHKTKSVLHIKLFERERELSQRELQRQSILFHIEKAIDRLPTDDSLYRSYIFFTSEDKKGKAVEYSLNKIINKNIVISRSDIPYYVAEAVETNNFILAQKFIDKAREWYKVSRVINNAQEYLDKRKNS